MKRFFLAILMILPLLTLGQTSPTEIGAWTYPLPNFTPNQPRSVTATGELGRVDLTWVAPIDVFGTVETDIATYTIQRKVDTGAYSTLTTVLGSVFSYSDGTATVPTSVYYYRISATDSATPVAQTGAWSTEASASPTADTSAPTVPSGLATVVNGTQITLSWTASSDIGGGVVSGYAGARSTNSDFTANVASFSLQTQTSYAFSGLAENTLYYFRVQAIDNSGNSSIYATTTRTSGFTSSGPSISGVSPTTTYSHNNIVTINGSGFGTNNVSADIWDNMESGSFNPAWSSTGDPVGFHTVVPSGVNARHANSNYNSMGNFVGTANPPVGTAGFSGGPLSRNWFAQYWFKLDNDWTWGTERVVGDTWPNGLNLSNIKVFRVWSNQTNENFPVATHGWENAVVATTENMNNGFTDYMASGYMQNWTKNVWHCFQFEYEESDLNQSNGAFRWWVDGQSIYNNSALMTKQNADVLKNILILGFFNSWSDGLSDDNHYYMDDAYINPSLARVEIGNNSLYESCTIRELQPPTAWVDGQISVTMNQGTFTTGQTVYVFVVDPSGRKSAGSPIVIGAGGVPVSDPVINTPVGAMYHGNNLTITGAGFGSKTAAPVNWNNFEEGTPGALFGGSNGWLTDFGDNPVGYKVQYSTSNNRHSNSTKTLKVPLFGTGTTPGEYADGAAKYTSINASNKLYLDCWVRVPDNNGGQIKFGLRCSGSPVEDAASMQYPAIFWTTAGTWHHFELRKDSMTPNCQAEGGPLTVYETDLFDCGFNIDGWNHIQGWFYMGDTNDTNFRFEGYVNGTQHLGPFEWDNIACDATPTPLLGTLILGGYFGNPESAGRYVELFYDDVYFDNTWARVEIGNASTYSACTVREIQIPTNWSPTSITFTGNRGSFAANSSAYLYVVNSNGTISAGVPITLDPVVATPIVGGVSDTTPTNGQAIVISSSGSNFGTMDTSIDVWDDLELSPSRSSTSGFNPMWSQTNQTGWYPGTITVASSGANARHANSLYNTTTNFNPTLLSSVFPGDGAAEWAHATKRYDYASSKWFAQYWIKLDNDFDWGGPTKTSNLGNIKFFRMWPSGQDVPICNYVQSYHVDDGTGWKTEYLDWDNTRYIENFNAPGFREYLTKNTWHCMQFQYLESDPATPNGNMKYWCDGQLIYEYQNLTTRDAGETMLKYLYGLGWFNSTNEGVANGDNHVYFDDFYANPSFSRVEIGNASTYSACTHREVQIPTNWTASSISIPVNQGSFANGAQSYLYVVNSNGLISSGYPIVIGSGVSGPLVHGSQLTITGSGFGTNDVSADIWDNMETGGFNPSWSYTNNIGINTNNQRHGQSSYNGMVNFKGSDYVYSGYFTGGSNAPKWYIQYWFKLDNDFDWGTTPSSGNSANLANVKFIRMFSPRGDALDNWVASTEGWTNSLMYKSSGPINESEWFGGGFMQDWVIGQWHLLQFEYKDSTQRDVRDGSVKFWVDGQLVLDDPSLLTRSLTGSLDGEFMRPLVVGFFNSWGDDNTDDDHFYIDDAYINPSFARVELGNAATYETSTHRELQIPEAWSDGSIRVTVNKGSFSSGSAYLFVINSNGTVVATYPVTIQ